MDGVKSGKSGKKWSPSKLSCNQAAACPCHFQCFLEGWFPAGLGRRRSGDRNNGAADGGEEPPEEQVRQREKSHVAGVGRWPGQGKGSRRQEQQLHATNRRSEPRILDRCNDAPMCTLTSGPLQTHPRTEETTPFAPRFSKGAVAIKSIVRVLFFVPETCFLKCAATRDG